MSDPVARAILTEAIVDYGATGIYAAFSGGHDSLCSTSVTVNHSYFRTVVHIDTGIGIPDTQEFVRSVCASNGWPLIVVRSPVAYEDFVMKYGFPGPGAHRYAYSWLKERALRQLLRQVKRFRAERIAISTGVRLLESRRRMGTVRPIQRNGSIVWVAPISLWTKHDINEHIERMGLPRNSVVDKIHMSGECLCGSFARVDEFNEIKFWFPAVAERIEAIEQRTRDAGLAECRWGNRVGEQELLPGMLCYGCVGDDKEGK